MINNLLVRLSKRATVEFYRRQYLAEVRSILKTRPLTAGMADFMLLSMVQKKDVLSYLVAVKSFAHNLNPRQIVVVCDPSIDVDDRSLLRAHIPHIELRDAGEFVHPKVPRGGTWERLLAIAGFAAKNYVVQLDADTITLANLVEVQDAIEKGHGFVIGEEPAQQIYSLSETAARVRLPPATPDGKSPHIQIAAEAVIARIGLDPARKYVRGCSGFTGFPPDPDMLSELVRFAEAMTTQFGERWREWGTEQITSNYLVANCKNKAAVLSYPDYGTPNVEASTTVFLHFIGPMRFVSGRYKQLTQRVITTLVQNMSVQP